MKNTLLNYELYGGTSAFWEYHSFFSAVHNTILCLYIILNSSTKEQTLVI